jgi:hypothetical protein
MCLEFSKKKQKKFTKIKDIIKVIRDYSFSDPFCCNGLGWVEFTVYVVIIWAEVKL